MDQNMFNTYFNCFEEALKKIIKQILGIELTSSRNIMYPEEKTFSSVVRVIGLNKGLVHVEISENLAIKLYEYANDEPVLEEMDLCFYIAEFTNMVAGSGVTSLNNMYKGSCLRLTPPAIFTGQELDINIPKAFSSNRSYISKLGTIRIEIGFEEPKIAN